MEMMLDVDGAFSCAFDFCLVSYDECDDDDCEVFQ